MLKKYELVEIAKAGGNIILNGGDYKKYELVEIAKSLKNGATLQINNSGALKKYELVDIVKANPGSVIIAV
ncbi:hypothetical protein [Aliarcobacter cryaerophilus]|mgnify:CR=1 FL=1|uniref:Uncharacterized protein n=1 Tax=Aliarcobacter cryaerophilus TaxID=28198 RepID=A0AA46NQD6_9BACT|nr:hypothetical protein [Aliarcobacter cryaerophilus]UYF42699.1 hypothetical protein NGX11_07235 [Aliarcobacter cryaerophilus]